MFSGVGSALISSAGGLLAGKMSSDSAEKQNAANIAFQREVAQNGIRWKVADAKAAGINPLFALGGMNGATASGGSSIQPDFSEVSRGISRAAEFLGRKEAEVADSQIEANNAVALKNTQEGEAALLNASSNATNAETNRLLASSTANKQNMETLYQTLNYTNANNYWTRLSPESRAKAWMFMNTPSNYIGGAGLTSVELAKDIISAGHSILSYPVTSAKQGARVVKPNYAKSPAIVFPDGSTSWNPSPEARAALDNAAGRNEPRKNESGKSKKGAAPGTRRPDGRSILY